MNEKAFKALFAVGAVAALALLAPVIFLAAQATAGLLILGVLSIAGLGLAKSLPLIGQKLENSIVKARKAEATKNPIEQLQNFLMQKAQQVAEFKSAVAMIGAQIKSLQDMVTQRKKERPGYDASSQESSIEAMRTAHATLTQKYVNAEKALGDLKLAISDKEFEWKFSQAGQKALATLNATSGQELMEQMLADTAFASVTDNFNHVFAELELEAKNLTNAQQLEYSPGMTIDVSSINLEYAR